MLHTQIKKIIKSLMLSLIFLFSITSITYAEGNYYNKDVKVEGGSYGSIVSSEYENLTLEFDYKWITENTNTVYNNKLARAAILLASNAYSDVYVTTSDTPDASDKKSALRELGIDDADIIYELYNEDNYDINTEDKGLDINDIAGITMGYKLITIGDNTYNVFIFVPDSTEGLAEWESNFDIGAGDGKDTDDYTILTGKHPDWKNHYNHKGFDVTATREKRIIDKFINDKNNPSYPTSILVCGHSRGGAVSNILSKLLVDENKYKVYAYTFGTPNTVEVNNKNNIKIEDYKQIFNHVNKDDFVTNMPSDVWGFNKYGITLSMKVSNYDEVKLLYDALVSKDSEVVDASNIPSTYAAPNIETTWDGNTKNIGVKETISNIATKRDDFYKLQTRTITYSGDADTKNNLINHRKGANDTILDDLDVVKTSAGVKVPYNGLYAYEVIEDGIMEHYRQAILLRGMACILAKRSDIFSCGFMLLGLEYIEDTHSKFMGDENETNTLITFSKENPSKKFNDFLEQILNNANTLGVPHTTASYYAMTTLRDINDMKINYNDSYNYTGEEIKPVVNVNDIISWEQHDDYEITYSNNIEIGTGLISINSLMDQFNLSNDNSALLVKKNLQEDTKTFINNLDYKLIGNRLDNFYIEIPYGSSNKSSKKTYKVTNDSDKNKGDVVFNSSKVKKGTLVKVTVKPKEGYEVKGIIITDENGNKISNKFVGDNNYEFEMPSKNVNIE
ncbi:MAG: hypothetical protein MJ244_06045, partial [Clostridia bacterium]|nr:hypothetical protein [Clostridia bacterium]